MQIRWPSSTAKQCLCNTLWVPLLLIREILIEELGNAARIILRESLEFQEGQLIYPCSAGETLSKTSVFRGPFPRL